MNSTADPLLRFEHENAESRGLERQRSVQPGDARSHDHDVAL
jgi:hypothetical protein